jgi:hypothetical protein
MDAPREVYIGDFFIRTEVDIVFIRPSGDLDLAAAQAIVQVGAEIEAQHGPLFMLGDLHDARAIPAEARRLLVAHAVRHPPAAVAFHNVGLVARGVNALLFGAINMLGKQRQNLKQFSSESDARAWLAAERRRIGRPESIDRP